MIPDLRDKTAKSANTSRGGDPPCPVSHGQNRQNCQNPLQEDTSTDSLVDKTAKSAKTPSGGLRTVPPGHRNARKGDRP